MAKPRLSNTTKTFIADMYVRNNVTQLQLAKAHNVSPRTIQRALIEKGVLTPGNKVSKNDLAILKVARGFNLDAQGLIRRLNQTAINKDSVARYLTELPQDDLAILLFNAQQTRTLQLLKLQAQRQQQAQQYPGADTVTLRQLTREALNAARA